MPEFICNNPVHSDKAIAALQRRPTAETIRMLCEAPIPGACVNACAEDYPEYAGPILKLRDKVSEYLELIWAGKAESSFQRERAEAAESDVERLTTELAIARGKGQP